MFDFTRPLTEEEELQVKKILETPVTIAFQTTGNDIYAKLLMYCLEQQRVFTRLNVVTVNHHRWDTATELLFAAGLGTCADYIHILDSDVAPRQDTLVKLMSRDLDIVAAPVYMYDSGVNCIHLNYHSTDELLRETCPKAPEFGLEKVFSSSFACVLIKRRVLEMFMQTRETFTSWSKLLPEKFKNLNTDTIFFAKCQAMGFDVWLDWDCEIATHHRYIALGADSIESFTAQRILGYVLGSQKVKEMLKSGDGRERLAQILRDSPDTFRSGQPPDECTGDVQGETGEEVEVGADGLRKRLEPVTGTVE